MSKLYFICGCMGAAKSTQLLAKEFNYRENGKKTLIVKPTTDTRNGVTYKACCRKCFKKITEEK